MFKCEYCGKEIGNLFNLSKHIKLVHELNLSQKQCGRCLLFFASASVINKKFYKTKFNTYQSICKNCTIQAVNNEIINCSTCGKQTYKRNLQRHKRSIYCKKIP